MWISWSGNHLTVGRGQVVGVDPVLIFTDSSPIDIQYMSVANIIDNMYYACLWTIPAEFYTNGTILNSKIVKKVLISVTEYKLMEP